MARRINRQFKLYLMDDVEDPLNCTEVRRFNFNVDADVATNFVYLRETLQTIFPDLRDKNFTVNWKDNEHDTNTISTNEELEIAIHEMDWHNIYKLYISVKSERDPIDIVHSGMSGLKNLGDSCYMNSIIQCLSNTTNLAKYFTDNSNNDNMTQGQVVEEVARVINALWTGQYKSVSPRDLKVIVEQHTDRFEPYEQQDSHEFLTFLLEHMHYELKKEANIPIELTNAEKEWDKAMNSERSIISDLFFGLLRCTTTCSCCKQANITYKTFNSLTMSLPRFSRCSLNECMEEKFVTGQKVSEWECPKCQIPRDATKKFDFVKLAPIVVIHLNRFAYGWMNGEWLEKRNTAVDFPLTGFNLKPYLMENTIMSNNIRNYNYSLYAISNHCGMDGGHYTAFCKNPAQNTWYKYDDETVTEVSPSKVKSQDRSAYLLFYTSFPNTIM
ncbi:ubiquitin carboxyl-terminal hydrolase 2-like [Temnothorax longispinosus]|uniref:ubiquitinyl hydrolase 1 n=1 Tax=Temnothorax longispinosus TaxID=300112 RepID=A0A4V3SB08_9HYME|nr:Ubiquitin carboxyl-terminal hydrolase 8 [Temnothorax longispinosus]